MSGLQCQVCGVLPRFAEEAEHGVCATCVSLANRGNVQPLLDTIRRLRGDLDRVLVARDEARAELAAQQDVTRHANDQARRMITERDEANSALERVKRDCHRQREGADAWYQRWEVADAALTAAKTERDEARAERDAARAGRHDAINRLIAEHSEALTTARAEAREEAERLRGVIEAAEALVCDWGCDAPTPCMPHGPHCRRCSLAAAFTAASRIRAGGKL